MRHIKEVLRLKNELNFSLREIQRATGIARSTVADYLERAQKAQLSWPLPQGMDQEQLWRKLFTEDPPASQSSEPTSPAQPLPDWSYIHQELRRKNVTLQLLWQEYRQNHPQGYGRSQFCNLYRQWAKKLDPVMRQTHEPGEKLFVDWAGDKISIKDSQRAEELQASLFVTAMGASHKIYAQAFLDEKLGSWICGHVQALTFYGGAPKLIVPDNPKTGVVDYCRYEPKLHPTYQEMAAHYRTAVLPARGGKPRDKAKAETAVQIAQRMILGALRDYTFFSLASLNQQIQKLLAQLNAKAFTQKEGSRDELFAKLDQPALIPLPDKPYELATWIKAKVNIDYHIAVDKHFYSVPYQYVREPVEVRLSRSSVEVYRNGKRIALHVRSYRPGLFTTIPEHRPKSHQKHLEWTPGRLIEWGRKIGPCCGLLVSHILQSRPHPEQGYRSCLGIMRLAGQVSQPRMEAACKRALRVGSHSYRSVKNILDAKLDQLEDQAQLTLNAPEHENLRGAHYYQQSLQQNS